MTTEKIPHDWSCDALFAKAQRYAATMMENDRTDWKFGFWSALVLEILARAAMAKISPALLADGKDWTNTLYAIGHVPAQSKSSPKSAETNEIIKRLEVLYPTFTREMANFAATHTNRRNSELHSAALAFDGLGSSTWLPMFYLTTKALAECIGESLEALFDKDEAQTAEDQILAHLDESAKSVNGTISAHKTIWLEKDDAERTDLSEKAAKMATRASGHRMACPSCGCTGLLKGNPIGSPRTAIEDGYVVERQGTLPSSFNCVACGLKIMGYSKLNACGLGDTYTSTHFFDAVEYFNIDIEEEAARFMFEEDNNEP